MNDNNSLKNFIRKKFTSTLIYVCLLFFVTYAFILFGIIKLQLAENEQKSEAYINNFKFDIIDSILRQDFESLSFIIERLNKQSQSFHFEYQEDSEGIQNSILIRSVPIYYQGGLFGYITIKYNLNFIYFYIIIAAFTFLIILIIVYLVLRLSTRSIENELIIPIMRTIELNASNLKKSMNDIQSVKKYRFKFSELQRFQDQISTLIAMFYQISKEKEELNTYKNLSHLAMQIAHDIRKLFSKISILIDELEEQLPNKKILKDMRDLFKTDIQIIEGLLLDLINLGTKKSLKFEAVSIKSLIENAIDIVIANYKNPQVEFEYDYKHKSFIFVDPNKLSRALINIIDNAFQAMKMSGKILISTSEIKEEGASFLKLSIKNNGPIIPEAKLKKIFSFDFSSDNPKGLGIGLASVRKVLEDHKGRVWCTSSKENGTAFHMYLPLSKKIDSFGVKNQNHPIRKVSPNREYSILKKQLSLIAIDDDSFYTEQIKKYSQRLELNFVGFQTREELSQNIMGLEVDIAFVDLTIDNETYGGYEVTKEILSLFPDCYVVIYSNHPENVEKNRMKTSGASSYVEKNMSFEIFLDLCFLAYNKKMKKKDALKHKENIESIIIIDDEEFYIERWQRAYKRSKTFLSPDDFLDYFEKGSEDVNSYDLIVCDYYFAGYDVVSIGFVDTLRNFLGYKGIIALSSNVSFKHVTGFDLVLEKRMYSSQELSRLIKFKNTSSTSKK